MADKQKVVLITGSNSGIGNATAKQAVAAGYVVYGGARRNDTFPSIQQVGAHPLYLDVTNEHTMYEAIRQIEAQYGAIDILINNAGYGEMGPVEEVSLERWRRQYETNVFGLVRMTQLVIPGMRKQGKGRIINISSMGGEFTFPLAAAYHSTKYAVESINDALRFELKPFGIDVITIQPSVVTTPLAVSAVETLQAIPNSPYQKLTAALHRMSRSSAGAITPERVARIIVSVMQSEKPRPRYKIGMMAQVLTKLHRWLPERTWDAMLRRLYR